MARARTPSTGSRNECDRSAGLRIRRFTCGSRKPQMSSSGLFFRCSCSLGDGQNCTIAGIRSRSPARKGPRSRVGSMPDSPLPQRWDSTLSYSRRLLGHSGCATLVAVMQTAELLDLDHATGLSGLNRPWLQAIHFERKMRPAFVIVRKICSQDATQVTFAEHDNMVQTIATNTADHSFARRVLPGAVSGSEYFFNAHTIDAMTDDGALDGVAVAEQVISGGTTFARQVSTESGPAQCGILSPRPRRAPAAGKAPRSPRS